MNVNIKEGIITLALGIVGVIGSSKVNQKLSKTGHLKSVIDEVSEPFFLIDRKWRFVYLNKEAESHFNMQKGKIIGKKLWDVYPPSIGLYLHEHYQKAVKERIDLEFEFYFESNQTWYSIRVYPTKDGLSIFFLDITDQKETYEKIKKREEYYRFIADNSTDIIMRINEEGNVSYISPSSEKILGHKAEEIINNSIKEFVHSDDVPLLDACELEQSKDASEFKTFLYRFRKKDNSFIWMETTARRIYDDNNNFQEFIAVSRDITERKNKEEALRLQNEHLLKLSTTDPLTNIGNRRSFDKTFNKEWKRAVRKKSYLSLIMVDVDFFKGFNDTYGHEKGDDCLIKIAKVLRDTVKRPSDFIARIGGEEFVILLPDTKLKGACKVAESIRKNIMNLKIPHKTSPKNKVTVSAGVTSLVPKLSDNQRDLMMATDQALYNAKESGRNKVKVVKRVKQ